MQLGDIVQRFIEQERGVAILLHEDQVKALAVSAVSFYCGYNDLEKYPNTNFEDITLETDLVIAEWTTIQPLFLLYVERETALQMEATGMQGVSGYGRGSSEINSEITRYETDFAQMASCFPAISVGGEALLSENQPDNTKFPFGFNYPIFK